MFRMRNDPRPCPLVASSRARAYRRAFFLVFFPSPVRTVMREIHTSRRHGPFTRVVTAVFRSHAACTYASRLTAPDPFSGPGQTEMRRSRPVAVLVARRKTAAAATAVSGPPRTVNGSRSTTWYNIKVHAP